MKKWLIAQALIIALPFIFPQPIAAHAFGKLYNLPVPFWLYLYGGVAAIVVSFLIIGYFFNKAKQTFSYPTGDLSKFRIAAILTSSRFFTTLKITGLFLFFLTILSGFLGTDIPRFNFNMTFFWIIFVLGFTYATAIFGNVWAIVNPWKTLFEALETLFGKKMEGFVAYPKSLSYYPALILFFLFIWIELMGETNPQSLSMILLQYSIITFAAVLIFGKNIWFQYGEFFSVFFKLIAKLAPLEYKNSKLYLRLPIVGLLKETTDRFSLLLFILFMLSSTAFDGFRSTVHWVRLSRVLIEPPVGLVFGEGSFLTSQIVKTVGLILALIVSLYVYLVLVALAKVIAKSSLSFGELALRFAFSLVPIALAYNIAHYYTLIQTEGQNMFRIISDPFGVGWNLFKTATYETDYLVVNANFAWHSQVAVILAGHIAGVYLAHQIALNVFPSHKRAFASQLPMLILMVIYTMAGLWILSQPITSEI